MNIGITISNTITIANTIVSLDHPFQYQRLTFSTRRSLEPRVSIREMRNEGVDQAQELEEKLSQMSRSSKVEGK